MSKCEANEYTLCFELKQHSPLIHFQADEEGATLRESDVKSKLDKFLIKKFEEVNTVREREKKEKIEYKNYFTSHEAFDYNIHITPKGKSKVFDIAPIYYDRYNNRKPLSFPTFFASADSKNWKNKSENIKFVFDDSLILEVKVYNEELKQVINDNIANFFFLHNFGSRQSKGFGSYTIADTECSVADRHYYFKIDIDNHMNQNFPDTVTDIYKEYYNLFVKIDLFYKTLRSGINIGNFYFKSLLFLYAKDELNVQWDKKTFKDKFLEDNYREAQLKKHVDSKCKDILEFKSEITEDKYLLRDCLGLSTIQEYKKPRHDYSNEAEEFTIRHPRNNPNDAYNGDTIEVNNMQRLQSPLLIKIIRVNKNKCMIFIIPKPYEDYIFEEEITILKVKKLNNGSEQISDKIENMKLYPDFNLEEYLNFAFLVNIEEHLKNCGTNIEHRDSKTIRKMYQQLNLQAIIRTQS